MVPNRKRKLPAWIAEPEMELMQQMLHSVGISTISTTDDSLLDVARQLVSDLELLNPRDSLDLEVRYVFVCFCFCIASPRLKLVN